MVVRKHVLDHLDPRMTKKVEEPPRVPDTGHRVCLATGKLGQAPALPAVHGAQQSSHQHHRGHLHSIRQNVSFSIDDDVVERGQARNRFPQRAGRNLQAVTESPGSINDAYFQVSWQAVMLQAVI